jgi:hypothetical protein
MMIRVVMFSAILFAAASVSAAAETGDDGGRLVIGQGANSCWAWTRSHEAKAATQGSVHAMRGAKLSCFVGLRFIKLSILQMLFCTDRFISRLDLRLLVQNHVQQGFMDFDFSVVFDETQLAEFVHEKTYP